MLHLNARFRATRSFFSREALKSRFYDPEFYLAENVDDIKKSKLLRTRYKLFPLGKKLVDKSVLFIPSCSIEIVKNASGEIKEARGEKNTANDDETEIAQFIKTAPNAIISDHTGKLPVMCPFNIEDNPQLEKVIVYYYHRLGLYRLEHSSQTPSSNQLTKQVLERIITIMESCGPISASS